MKGEFFFKYANWHKVFEHDGDGCNSFCEATVCKELVFGHYIFGFDNSICFLFRLGHWLHLFPCFKVHIFGDCIEKHPENSRFQPSVAGPVDEEKVNQHKNPLVDQFPVPHWY